MTRNPKSVPASHAADSSLVDFARQGAAGFIATQEILLDLAVQQNSLALGFVRERLRDMPFGSVGGLAFFAAQGAANFMAAQQILLDLAVRENAAVHQGVKDGLGLTGTAAALADVLHGGVDAFVAMQRKFLELAAEQGDIVVQSVMAGTPLAAAAPLAEKAQEGLRTFVQTQERFLDMVAQQVSAPPARNRGKTGTPAQRKKLTEHARAGVDAFVAAGKQLMTLASAQIAATAAAALPASAEPSTPLGEVARRGAVNLVNAQKALLDVAAKLFLPPPTPRPAARKR